MKKISVVYLEPVVKKIIVGSGSTVIRFHQYRAIDFKTALKFELSRLNLGV